MLAQRRWTDTDGTGVRAQLLAQKELHQMESQPQTASLGAIRWCVSPLSGRCGGGSGGADFALDGAQRRRSRARPRR